MASDTISIPTMEVVDTLFILLVPRAIDATIGTALFWWSLVVSLAVASAPRCRSTTGLRERGRGHAVVHRFHEEHAHPH